MFNLNFSNIMRSMNGDFFKLSKLKNRGENHNHVYKVIKEIDIPKLLEKGIYILDVRTKTEFEAMRFKNAVNIPLAELDFNILTYVTDKSSIILVYCLTGDRTKEAIKRLNNLGYTNIYVWEGSGLNSLKNGQYIEY